MGDVTRFVPIGFKFDPTDEDLVLWYLYRKIMDLPLDWRWMAEKELYGDNAEPSVVFSDIDDSSPYWNTKEEGGATKKTIYVYTKVTKTSANSKRNSRRAGSGTWTGQTGPKNIINSQNGAVVGCTRMLTYQHSKKGSNDLNHWIMHEYSFIDAGAAMIGERKNDVVLCKITKFVKESEKRRMRMQEQVQPPPQPYFPAASICGTPTGNKRRAEEGGGEESNFAKKQRVESFGERKTQEIDLTEMTNEEIQSLFELDEGSFGERENGQKTQEIDLTEMTNEEIQSLFQLDEEVVDDNMPRFF